MSKDDNTIDFPGCIRTNNVVDFPGDTRLDTPPDDVLESAKGHLTEVLVIGKGAEGDWFACSTLKTGDILLMLKRFEFKVLRGDFN